jgi:DNA-binding transcriptional regulator GbsR (MarR family)
MELDVKEAKEIIRAGFAWANWTEEQKQAFKFAYESIDKVEQLIKTVEKYEKALREISRQYENTSVNRSLEIAKEVLNS